MLDETPRAAKLIENADGAILLDIVGDRFYSLNPVGSLIWKRLAAHEELANIVAEISTLFVITPDIAQRDVDAFVSQLRMLKLAGAGQESASSIHAMGEGEQC